MSGKASRKGLSPLLAIIIGLVVTIVAGILLAQLYFSYAATLSARPGVNLEYVDAVEGGENNDILVLNLKNVGNVPINVSVNNINVYVPEASPECTPKGNGNPGGVISVTCTGNLGDPGALVNGTVSVVFTDGSNQTIAFKARLRVG
ncbi:MAG: hypothetical protein QW330_04210 [Nitrososphaerota archaeon]